MYVCLCNNMYPFPDIAWVYCTCKSTAYLENSPNILYRVLNVQLQVSSDALCDHLQDINKVSAL